LPEREISRGEEKIHQVSTENGAKKKLVVMIHVIHFFRKRITLVYFNHSLDHSTWEKQSKPRYTC